MKFVVEGKIKGKARPRWSSKSASMYTPLETKQYEDYIAPDLRTVIMNIIEYIP